MTDSYKEATKHMVREATTKERLQDCCGDRYACNVDYVCSCGEHLCDSDMKRHIFKLHLRRKR